MRNANTVTTLGVRGTVPVEGAAFSRYGGATSCTLARLGDALLILDGGTGILSLSEHLDPEETTLHVLLTHAHVDHIIGLLAWPALFDARYTVHLYATPRAGLSPLQQLERLMEPPLWPVGPAKFSADIRYHAIEGDVQIGDVGVRTLAGAHPGGCTVFRLEWDGRSLVYATDYELNQDSAPTLAGFAQGCTLLLCDGQYDEAERASHRGFGHSTWTDAARLAKDCGTKALRVLHHAPWRTDEALDQAEPELQRLFNNGAFARSGEKIEV